MAFRLEREERAPGIRWVHLYATEGESLEGADRRVNTEARKWARELGMRPGSRVSSGGQYGDQEWRHSVCYRFRGDCEGHYDDNGALTSGAGIGEPQHCDGACVV